MAGELKAEISREFVFSLGMAIESIEPAFSAERFGKELLDSTWTDLELKARLQRVATVLGDVLACEYPHSIALLKEVAGRFSGLPALVFPEYVAQFGLGYWDVSIEGLAFFTSISSSEFAVRPFIRRDPEVMMQQMLVWADNDNFHVRRLASEGCRPRLPWASPLRRFIKDPSLVLPILERLRADSEEYVRRSVANNLNDISKDHPDLVMQLAQEWYGDSRDVDRVVKHGLRSLLKRGDTKALLLFGYENPEKVQIDNLQIANGILHIGESGKVRFDLVLQGKSKAKLRLEYAVYYLKANGKTSKKIFQAGEYEFMPGVHTIEKKQSFRQMTTRKHYPGKHGLSVIVNGREMAVVEFDLLAE